MESRGRRGGCGWREEREGRRISESGGKREEMNVKEGEEAREGFRWEKCISLVPIFRLVGTVYGLCLVLINARTSADRATSCLGLCFSESIGPGINHAQSWYQTIATLMCKLPQCKLINIQILFPLPWQRPSKQNNISTHSTQYNMLSNA